MSSYYASALIERMRVFQIPSLSISKCFDVALQDGICIEEGLLCLDNQGLLGSNWTMMWQH